MAEINIDDFSKVEIRIGKILEAEKVDGADKLLKLIVDFGTETKITKNEETGEETKEITSIRRQILSGIAQYYEPEALIGKECPFVFNLASRKLRGFESQGMILCPSGENGPVLLHPDKQVPPGSLVK
jgi:tRNA-binding EMAP/Myf-like protein